MLADEDADYLVDGVAESLIRQLSTLPSVRVTPLSVALNFKGQPVEPRDAGRQLGVDTVLAGALTLESGRLQITAELVDVDSGIQLWSNAYDREASELLDIQDEIARAILDDGLRVELNDDERLEVARGPTVDGEAYDLYLQARYLQRRATENRRYPMSQASRVDMGYRRFSSFRVDPFRHVMIPHWGLVVSAGASAENTVLIFEPTWAR